MSVFAKVKVRFLAEPEVSLPHGFSVFEIVDGIATLLIDRY